MINGLIDLYADQAVYQELWGGAEGIRTPDPLDANEVRYRTALQPLTETSLPSASASATTGAASHAGHPSGARAELARRGGEGWSFSR